MSAIKMPAASFIGKSVRNAKLGKTESTAYIAPNSAARAYLHLRSKSPHTLAEPSTIR